MPTTLTDSEIFRVAAKMPQERRSEFLDQACAGDRILRADVESLLRAHDQSGSFLQSPAAATVELPDRQRPGDMIGPYKLREQIGEGGFGIVYVAEQFQPVRRKVAIKIIKPGMSTTEVVARFEAERQALALMDHPNIARVIDGGATESDLPYFVMELVQGLPITQYCDERRLNTAERLQLCAKVCQAVQHAHQRGIIHRDLKPSNVLVAEMDGVAVPKVIDFGIAKAINQKLSDHSVYTHFSQIVGTPPYMSPEQAGLGVIDIDTRTDVYSLGVMLYELLTGSTPFDSATLKRSTFDEMRRIIREQEPARPSRYVGTLGVDALSTVAERRGLDPRKLTALLRGELDWIVMKCLEKDRTRRYESAGALTADLERYLAAEAVEACPPSTGYRLRKFVRRNRVMLLAASVTLLTMLVGIICSTWGMLHARHSAAAERRARRQAQLNESKMVQAADAARQANRESESERDKATAARDQLAQSLEREQRTSYAYRIGLAQREWEASQVDRARQILEECPVALRHWEWHYLRRLCNSERVSYRRHRTDVRSVAVSPDGEQIATASSNDVRVWKSSTGAEIFQFELKPEVARGAGIAVTGGAQVAFSPDGKWLAVAAGGSAMLLDARTGQETRRFVMGVDPPSWNPYSPFISAIAFSPDSKSLATAGSLGSMNVVHPPAKDALMVWNVESGERHHSLALSKYTTALVFGADGTTLAVGFAGIGGESPRNGNIQVWNSELSELKYTLEPSSGERLHPADARMLRDMAIHPDGRQIAAAMSDGTVRVWDIASERESLVLHGHTGPLRCVAFSLDGKLIASGGVDRVVRVWDAATGEVKNVLRGPTAPVRDVAFTSDSRGLVAGFGTVVHVWDATVGQASRLVASYPAVPATWSIAFSPDSSILATAGYPSVSYWDTKTGQVLRPPLRFRVKKPQSAPGPNLAFQPQGDTIGIAGGDETGLWKSSDGTQIRTLPDAQGIAFDYRGARIATVGNDQIAIWDFLTGRKVLEILKPEDVRALGDAVVFSPDSQYVATAARGLKTIGTPTIAMIWDSQSGRLIQRIEVDGELQYNETRAALAFVGDSRRIAVAQGLNRAVVWEVPSGKPLYELRGHSDLVSCLSVSSDGKRIVTASADNTMKIWDAHSGQELLTLRGQDEKVICVAYSFDGLYLASVAGSTYSQIHLWDGRPLRDVR